MGSYQYVLANSDLRIALNDDCQGREVRLSKGTEQSEKLSIEESKKIRSVSKGESYSVSKIWQWSNKSKLSTSSGEDQVGMPSSLKRDLPWMQKTEGK